MKKQDRIKNLCVLLVSIMAVFCVKAQIYSGYITKNKHYASGYSIYLEKIQSDFNQYIIRYNNIDTNYQKGDDKQYSTHIKDILHSLNSIAESNIFNNYNVAYASDIIAEYKKDSTIHVEFIEIHFKNKNDAHDAYENFYKKRKQYHLYSEIAQQFKLINKERILIVLHSESVLDDRVMNFINNYNF